MLRRFRSISGGFGGSPLLPSGSSPRFMQVGDNVRIDAMFVVPGRCPSI
jgi:hypothetical protein